jgi:methyl-accepting chemotaxis protein
MKAKSAPAKPVGQIILCEVLSVLIEELARERDAIGTTLKRAGDMTLKEVHSAGENVARICEASAQHALELDELKRDEARGSSRTFAAELAEVLSSIPMMIRRMVNDAQSQAHQAKKAREQIAGMRALLDAIGQIATDCRALASKARIEAADTAASSRAFGAVADDLKEVARKAQSTANEIEKLGHGTLRILDGLVDRAERVAADGQLQMEKFDAATAKCQEVYAGAVLGTLRTLGTRAEEIREQSNRTLTHLQFQDRVQQALDHAMEQSGATVAMLQKLIVDMNAGNRTVEPSEFRQMVRAARTAATPSSALDAPRGDGEIKFL